MPVTNVLLPQTAVGVYAAKTTALARAGTWVVTVKVEGIGRDRAADALSRDGRALLNRA